jgi:TonB family protein
MFCKHCGKQIKENAKFCGTCGKPVAANIPVQQINPDNSSTCNVPAQPESRRSTLEPVTPTVEAPKKREAAQQPDRQEIPATSNRKPFVIGIAIALILGLAIGAVSFYLLRPGPRPDDSISTARTVAATEHPVAGTLSPSANVAPPTTQTAAPNAASPPAFTCFDLSKGEPHSLEGRLIGVIFADDYGDIRTGDEPVGAYVLQLKSSICIQGDDNADPKVQISEVQLFPKNWDLKIEATMRSMLGFDVRTEFAGVQPERTVHDHRPLIGWVSRMIPADEVTPRTIIPRIISPHIYSANQTEGAGPDATVVQAFYIALSLGYGEIASSFVVPEKRSSGAFAPENLSKFYGPLPEPPSLVEMKVRGPNDYLVKYTYGTSTRRCHGRAIVTTTQRDGLNFIERIHELEGCGAVSSKDNVSVAGISRTKPRGPNNGQERVTRTIAPTPSLTSASRHTNIRQDPQYPLKIGEGYYPDASKRANEEGRCVVKLTVAADGHIVDQSIQESSGFQRLDDACLKGVRGQRMLPATENGRPIETTAAVPIVWKLKN